jgi:hypothetical protein
VAGANEVATGAAEVVAGRAEVDDLAGVVDGLGDDEQPKTNALTNSTTRIKATFFINFTPQ